MVWLTAVDVNGNRDSASAVVVVRDTLAPVALSRNLTVYLGQNGMASITPAMADGGSTDNCGISLSVSQDTFGCSDEGLNLETLTVTDVAGNISTANVLVDVRDTISPTLLTKTITVQLGATGQASMAPSQMDDGSFDNCTNQLFYSAGKTSFDCSDIGSNTIAITVTDNQGNSTSGTATVLVEDNISPQARAQNLTLQLDANGQASITAQQVDNGSIDNCGIDSIWLGRTAFDCSHLGQNTVLFSVRDVSGNVSTTNVVVTVQDMIAPSVVAQGLTVQLDANGQAGITAQQVDNGSTDNCGIAGMVLDIAVFGCNDLGANTVTLTVTDSSGNSGSATATVMVQDMVLPTVLTQDITVQLDANGQANITPAMVDNGSTDNCTVSSMVLDISSFDCSDVGTPVQVALTVTDNSNNMSSGTAMVTVRDMVPPVVSAQGQTLYLDANGQASITAAQVDNGSSDNCGIVGRALDISVFDCADLGQNLINLTVTDSSGNSAQQSAFVTILDTAKPSIDNLPATITAYAGPNQCGTTVQWPTLTASDNCGSTFINASQINGGLFAKGTTTVIVNVSDPSGNAISNTFDVVVVDTVSPVVSGVPTFFTTTPNSNSCGAMVSWNPPTAFDNCGSVNMTSSHAPGATFPVGSTQVTYTATDGDGNSTNISFTVTVNDMVDPMINGLPSDIVQTADVGICGAVVNFAPPTVMDNCTGATLSASHTPGSVFPVGTTTVTYTATDAANNSVSASFDITVEDNEAPVVTSVFQGDTVGPCGAAFAYPMPTATDNCGSVSINLVSGLPSGNVFPIGVTQNTFRISDGNGNDTTVSFTVVVVPQGQPELPNLIELCANAPAVDISVNQPTLMWTGNGIVNGNTFDPALAGVGRHQLSYTFTDSEGCQANGAILVTVLPAPPSPVINRVGTTTLSTTTSYAAYQWYRNGTEIAGATNQTYSYTQGGNYQVLVGNTSGCRVYGEGFVIGTSGGSIGLDEHSLLAALEVYPNPTGGMLVVDIHSNGEEDLELSVYSMDGKAVYTKRTRTDFTGKGELDLSYLPKAVYLLHVQSKGESAIKRIVIH